MMNPQLYWMLGRSYFSCLGRVMIDCDLSEHGHMQRRLNRARTLPWRSTCYEHNVPEDASHRRQLKLVDNNLQNHKQLSHVVYCMLCY